jgi:hypothetical protein
VVACPPLSFCEALVVSCYSTFLDLGNHLKLSVALSNNGEVEPTVQRRRA